MKVIDILNWYDGPTEILATLKTMTSSIVLLYYGCLSDTQQFDAEDPTFDLWSLPPTHYSEPGIIGYDGRPYAKPDLVVRSSDMDWSEAK